ncbi:MAG: 3-hydroxyacyl-CoA dehydrogenase, partial [Hyphomicrobiales bacterium]|nr:3-hydroxyacyl-CoA dehydrogenase [Hyphomicrobiales bacterium]
MSESGADPGDGIAVVGAGSIGVAFAIVFARAGLSVRLFDPDTSRREVALEEMAARLADLAAFDLLTETAEAITSRVTVVDDLAAAVAVARYVQECAPEKIDLKRQLFSDLDRRVPADAVLAGSSSAIPMSEIAADLAGRHRCVIVHPGNPPYLISPVEVVPAPFTDAATVERTRSMLTRAGLQPIVIGKEVEGFAFNRLQGALLREAYCLVRDGVATVDDIDRMVRDGLGLRWSVIGPFETADLNTRGG